MGEVGEAVVDEFEALFRADYARVVSSVRWVVADVGAAEEVAQDAFCRALERWDRVRRYDRPGAWVQVTALRLAIRRVRRDRRGRAVEPAWSPPNPDGPVDTDLIDAVAALPDGQRAVVALHYVIDLSVDDTAKVLGVSAGTVKTQLHRARARLAEVLGEPQEVPDGVG